MLSSMEKTGLDLCKEMTDAGFLKGSFQRLVLDALGWIVLALIQNNLEKKGWPVSAKVNQHE